MPPLRDTPDDARNILNGIKEAGFLESSASAWDRITQDTRAIKSTAARVFILTCDRPEALERLLSDLNTKEINSAIESIWIIDDSKQSASIDVNAEIIAAATAHLSVPITHVDHAIQEELLNHIGSAAPEVRESASFLLDKSEWGSAATYGRARNLALALSVGFRAVILDDDILLSAVAPPVQQRTLRLGSPGDREAKF